MSTKITFSSAVPDQEGIYLVKYPNGAIVFLPVAYSKNDLGYKLFADTPNEVFVDLKGSTKNSLISHLLWSTEPIAFETLSRRKSNSKKSDIKGEPDDVNESSAEQKIKDCVKLLKDHLNVDSEISEMSLENLITSLIQEKVDIEEELEGVKDDLMNAQKDVDNMERERDDAVSELEDIREKLSNL